MVRRRRLFRNPAAGLSDDELRSLERVGSVSSASLPAVGSSYVASSLSWRFVECLGERLGSLELYAAELDSDSIPAILVLECGRTANRTRDFCARY